MAFLSIHLLLLLLPCCFYGTTSLPVHRNDQRKSKKCEAPRSYSDLTADILSKLDDMEASAKSLDDNSMEDENIMNIYLETEPLKPKHLKNLLKRNATTESEINREANVARFLFSGDIRRSKSKVMSVTKSAFDGDVRYDAITEELSLWPNKTIPYTFNCSFNADGKAAVRVAMNEISRKTCLRFVKRKKEANYVEFFHGRGCWSFAGNMKLGKQLLSLQKDGCTHKGIAVHEIMHTLGYEHEHNRPDRDNYIKVVWKNIGEKDKVQFRILENNTNTRNGIKYDYGSIMHYADNEFAKKLTEKTIIPKEDGVFIGQRRGMSDTDARSVNQLYCNCNETDYRVCVKQKPLTDFDLEILGHV